MCLTEKPKIQLAQILLLMLKYIFMKTGRVPSKMKSND